MGPACPSAKPIERGYGADMGVPRCDGHTSSRLGRTRAARSGRRTRHAPAPHKLNSTHSNSTQPNSTEPNPTQPNPTQPQLKLGQPNLTQLSPTQPKPTEPSSKPYQTQLNSTQLNSAPCTRWTARGVDAGRRDCRNLSVAPMCPAGFYEELASGAAGVRIELS